MEMLEDSMRRATFDVPVLVTPVGASIFKRYKVCALPPMFKLPFGKLEFPPEPRDNWVLVGGFPVVKLC